MFSIRDTASAAVAALASLAVVALAAPAAAAPAQLGRVAVRGAHSQAASSFTVLHAFNGTDGANPQGALDLAVGFNGNTLSRTIYGTTLSGGATNEGTIYSYGIEAGAFASLHSMAGPTDGSSPTGGLASNATDYFAAGATQLGVNAFGGSAFFGTVYATSSSGHVTVLHNFSGNADGGIPVGRMTQFVDGNYYGTTSIGGSGFGTIFRITSSGQFATVYAFSGNADGGSPAAGLSLRLKVFSAPAARSQSALSALELVRAHHDWRFVSHYLYGTTSGANGTAGTVFRFNPATQRVETLHAFSGGNDGGSPVAMLSTDLRGNLYGTASTGGAGGSGVVFMLNAANTFAVLHTFAGTDGATPLAPVTVGFNGNLYGTTSSGGVGASGNVFRLRTGGGFTVLHDFTGGADGANPAGKLVDGFDGNLYGTAQNGGAGGVGVLFTTPG